MGLLHDMHEPMREKGLETLERRIEHLSKENQALRHKVYLLRLNCRRQQRVLTEQNTLLQMRALINAAEHQYRDTSNLLETLKGYFRQEIKNDRIQMP